MFFFGSNIADIFSAILGRLSPIISRRYFGATAEKISPILQPLLPILNIAKNGVILADIVWLVFDFFCRFFSPFHLPSPKLFAICTITSYSSQLVPSTCLTTFSILRESAGSSSVRRGIVQQSVESFGILRKSAPVKGKGGVSGKAGGGGRGGGHAPIASFFSPIDVQLATEQSLEFSRRATPRSHVARLVDITAMIL